MQVAGVGHAHGVWQKDQIAVCQSAVCQNAPPPDSTAVDFNSTIQCAAVESAAVD